MNTNWLREFVVLADTCSYAEAAARLFMGQSSLSKHIKALEEELGLGLFERTSRRVRLSREGELLLPSARALVEAEFALEAQARRCLELSRGKLDLAALPSMPSYGITELISGFMAKRPDCLVNVTECRTSEAERALREGSCSLPAKGRASRRRWPSPAARPRASSSSWQRACASPSSPGARQAASPACSSKTSAPRRLRGSSSAGKRTGGSRRQPGRS